ncbi:MAG TPA: ABC transporter substrate-binding protein [Thermoanaerobaculia bacterium]
MRIALAVALAGFAVACGPPPPPTLPTDNSLTIALESAPIQFDPRVATDQSSSRVFELAMNGLVTKDENGRFVPDLAERWELLDGGTRWRFHLRRDVVFHDGRPLSAADVVWTYSGLVDGTLASAKRGAYAQVAGVAAVDEHTVDFTTRGPFGALLGNLTAYVAVVPAGRTPEEMNERPIGTGPFRVVGRSPERVELAAFDGFFRGRPPLDRVVLREVPDATVRVLELRKGTVQLVVNGLPPDVVPLFEGDERFRVVRQTGSGYIYLGLNLEDPILADLRVRRALALSLDRETLVRTLWRGLGVPTETMLPPGFWARHDELEPIPHDPAAAMVLLDEAGFPDPDGPGGAAPRLTLTYKTSTDETSVLQAQVLQAMAAAAGIRLEIRSLEFATLFSDVQRGIFQLFSLTRTGIDDPDIYALVFHSRNVPPKGANRGRYRNRELDRLLELGASFAEPERRRPIYLEVQEIVARDLPYVSLFTRVNVAVMPRQLAGFRHFPSGELLGVRDLRWELSPPTPSRSTPP